MKTISTATFIKQVTEGFSGDARLYRLDPPVRYEYGETEYVTVSGINNSWGVETYIFPADESGHVIDWGELEGSFRGGIDHTHALDGAGYEVVV